MPLFKEKQFDAKSRLGIWKIDESVDELLKYYPWQREDELFQNLKTERRQKEYLAARITLHQINGQESLLLKDENGKPYLPNNLKHISISHAKGWAAAFVAEQPAGVDIENFRDKIFKVAHKFESPSEKTLSKGMDRVEALTLLWSAKESIFKKFSALHLAFLEEMLLKSKVTKKRDLLLFEVIKDQKSWEIEVQYEMEEEYVLTWC